MIPVFSSTFPRKSVTTFFSLRNLSARSLMDEKMSSRPMVLDQVFVPAFNFGGFRQRQVNHSRMELILQIRFNQKGEGPTDLGAWQEEGRGLQQKRVWLEEGRGQRRKRVWLEEELDFLKAPKRLGGCKDGRHRLKPSVLRQASEVQRRFRGGSCLFLPACHRSDRRDLPALS